MKFEGYSMPLHEEEDKYQKLFEETNTYHYNGICSSSDDELYLQKVSASTNADMRATGADV